MISVMVYGGLITYFVSGILKLKGKEKYAKAIPLIGLFTLMAYVLYLLSGMFL